MRDSIKVRKDQQGNRHELCIYRARHGWCWTVRLIEGRNMHKPIVDESSYAVAAWVVAAREGVLALHRITEGAT